MTLGGRITFVMCAVVAGCGGSGAQTGDGGPQGSDGGDDGPQSGDGALTPADQTFIADFCAAMVPCCTANQTAVDAAVCKQSLAKLPMSSDPQLRAACLDQLRQLSTSVACVPDIGDLHGPCVRLFNEPSGPREPGETCKTARECAGSPGTVTHCFNTCITDTLGAANDYPCLGNVYTPGVINDIPWKNGSNTPESHGFLCEVRAGLFCDFNDNLCKPVQPGGGACTTAVPGLCESGACGDTGCLPLPGPGEACTTDCKGDNYCNAGVCTPRLAAGAACADSSDQCSGVCAGSNRCYGTCVQGACSPLTVWQSLLLGVWCGATPVQD